MSIRVATAYLLQSQGYECIGATMKLYSNDAINNDGHTCCSLDDVEDARDVAFRLESRITCSITLRNSKTKSCVLS